MRILISAIGSMSADAVIRSLRSSLPDALLVGTDIHTKEWLFLSKKVDFFYQVPRAVEPDYLGRMMELCHIHRVEYIIPLTDPEVDIISEHRDLFDQIGVKVTLANEPTVRICRNKRLLYEQFRTSSRVSVIPSFTYDELNLATLTFPLVAKPINGRSSEGLRYIQDSIELESLAIKKEIYIFQPYLSGQIFTVDILMDAGHNFVGLPRKELIRTSNGAGLTIQTQKNEDLIAMCYEIAAELNVLGCMNFEFIHHDQQYFLMDINPRFSAGVGFSKLAGYDFVINHFRVFAGHNITWKYDIREIVAVKHFGDYIID